MGRFTRLIGLAALGASLVGLAIGAAQGGELSELVRAMVALLVAALPVGLPIVLTITLAISVSRMAGRNAIVRRLPAVETLGSCTVIGSDKTGTLTQNRMTVARILSGGRWIDVTGSGYAFEGELLDAGRPADRSPGSPLERTLLAGALANVASVVPAAAGEEPEVTGDPTEIALLVSAAKAGLGRDALLAGRHRAGDIPFDSKRRFAARFFEHEGRTAVYVKGAPEQVLAMCTRAAGEPQLDRDAVLAAAETMAADGLRVLAMATAEVPTATPQEHAGRPLRDLEFAGLQGMIDPPREEAREAVAACRRAGIRTVMITGDHATTGLAIARQLRPQDDVLPRLGPKA